MIYCSLADRFHWTFDEIGRMTPLQIFIAIMGTKAMDASVSKEMEKEDQPTTQKFASLSDAQAYLESRQRYGDEH